MSSRLKMQRTSLAVGYIKDDHRLAPDLPAGV